MPFIPNYTPNYFAITDILCTEERLACRIQVDLPGMGFLDPSSESEDLKLGSEIEFPLWLAVGINGMYGGLTSVDVPKIYKEGYREILGADASAIVLSKWNPYFYELGMHLRKFTNRDTEKMTESLLQTFKSRFRVIMNWAQNPISDPTLSSQLPRLEKDLFLSGREAQVRLNEWLKKGAWHISTSDVAINLKKRKRNDFDVD